MVHQLYRLNKTFAKHGARIRKEDHGFYAILGIGSEIHPSSFLLIQATSLPATQREERLRGRINGGSVHCCVEVLQSQFKRQQKSVAFHVLPAELQEGHEVHPLVLGLLQEGVDPALVPLHPAQGLQVADHTAGEPRHPRHRLQEDCSKKRHLILS
jgi:hypothetical protein